jgi:hypothetical protein
MLAIIKEHRTIHRRGVRPVVQFSTDRPLEDQTKAQLHTVNVMAKKISGEMVEIELSINAYILNYGPCIYYDIITNVPYIEGHWMEHPFKGVRLENSIEIGDHIDDTPSTRKIIEDIIVPDNWKMYIKPGGIYKAEQVKSTKVNTVIDMSCLKDSTDLDPINVDVKVRVTVLELGNNQIALKVSTNVPMKEGEFWSQHPFGTIRKKGTLQSITGILNDTPTVRQMIDDLVSTNTWKLYVTYDCDYRSHLIASLCTLFVKSMDEEKTHCQVINDLIKSLTYHWS